VEGAFALLILFSFGICDRKGLRLMASVGLSVLMLQRSTT
jgi:hypothetical protein